ncbi:TetR family transcriptional regulator [Streptomyces spiroverticillatus]|uniref:TetR family transcriptional regulator n=1 Tax=Streptomyces finlayi TaxID=67296 RepID=A0A918WVU9_9ACTN|nr:TetR/AcrR family transcriptional regulator [Streptomyces finlayi]GHA05496.1 TetR family transcriptional regulator [Streptomyces spiroverticillatus]GHC89362.1 TetR family transcriptional regulator [Streptomyces finlayi]
MSAGGVKGEGASVGYAKGRARREQIVRAAAEVYADVGYNAASLREIAKRVGISHVGLLHHFPHREALLAAVLERRDAEDDVRFAPEEFSPEAAVRHLVELADHNARHPGMVELYVRLAAEAIAEDHPAHAYFRDHYARTRAYVQRALQGLAEQGELRDGVDPRTAADGFVALMDGLQVQWLTGRGHDTHATHATHDTVDMPSVLRAYVRQLLKEPLA